MKILFVCLGNICRSATAQAVMESIIAQHSKWTTVEIDSAGILNYHEGELPDSRMRMHASRRGYQLTHRSRPVVTDDFDNFDLIIGMDDRNIDDLKKLAPSIEAENKIHRMTDYAIQTNMDYVPDPYYGGANGFELVIDLLEDCCKGLAKKINKVSSL